MLPKSADVIGQLLPPGAAQSLLRDTAFFDGHGPLSHLLVLIGWSVFGILADILGHHSPAGFAARHARAAAAAREAAANQNPDHLAHARHAEVSQPYVPQHPTPAQYQVPAPRTDLTETRVWDGFTETRP
jgi:hypothetical protein